MTPLAVYLFAINIIAFVMMGTDKILAVLNKRRISEAALFLPMILGGSIGGLFAMFSFRHKTRHKKFFIGIPVLVVIHIILYLLYFKYFL